MTEVEKITKEAVESGSARSLFGYEEKSMPSQFSIFGGAAIPMGDFAKEESGGAKVGFTAGAQFVTGGTLGWIIMGSYSQNKCELPSYLSSMGMGGETGKWTSILALTGIKVGTANPTGANFFIAPLIGALFGSSPELDMTISETYTTWTGYGYSTQTVTIRATQKSASSTALAYGAALEINFSGTISIGARYIASKPKYDITATASGGIYSYTSSGKLEQETALIQTYIGIIF
jgi:hypothetical protein